MMALNKVVARKPTPLADLNMTLTDLGLEAQQLFSGPFGNVDNKNPDQLTQMYLGANQQVWWLMTTTELYNSLADQQGLVATIPGFLNMPSFDKVLMGDTPATSGFCLFYHLSEQHLYSQQLRDLKLVMFVPETRRQQRRLGSGNVDVFNRGYVFHQLQVQEGSLVNLSTWELNKQVVFNVKPIQDNTNFVQVIANKFSWENGFLWTYNVPLRPTDILTQEDNRMRCLLQCLQYTGGEVLAKLPTETTKHVHTLLATMHPMVQQQFQTDFQYFGAKTTERLRGNSTIWSWISINYDQHYADYVKSTNDYRDQHQQQEVDQPEWQDDEDNIMDRPQRRQRVQQNEEDEIEQAIDRAEQHQRAREIFE